MRLFFRLPHILVFGTFLLLQACAAQSNLIEGEQVTITKQTLRYYLYYPEDYLSNPSQTYGLLLFLHGGGESAEPQEEFKANEPPKLLKEGKQFPFLILAPHNPHERKWWNTDAVMQLLDSIVAENRVDVNRIYLTGISRGGNAVWELSTQYPDRFAAMAVVCGMAPLPYAHWIDEKMPIWVFHGDLDETIPVEESDAMVEKLQAMHYNVRYTRYKGVGHNAWDRAYTTDSLYTWFAKQKRIN